MAKVNVYQEIGTTQSAGEYGIEINLQSSREVDWQELGRSEEVREAADKLKRALLKRAAKLSPGHALEIKRNREDVDLVFGPVSKPIFVEPIPNEYCREWCCEHLPWFLVTTSIGTFKVGWRKSVWVLDWDKTVFTPTAEEIFKNENVTKGRKMIHCHSLQDAQRYVAELFKEAGKHLTAKE